MNILLNYKKYHHNRKMF